MNSKNEINGWEYITNIVDVVKNPSLILDSDCQILFAGESFRRTFQVDLKGIQNKNIFQIADGIFNISPFKKLINEILPKNVFFNDLEVNHTFPFIGEKIFLVSAKKIKEIIFLTMEDVTITMTVAKTLATFATAQVEKIASLEKDIKNLKKIKRT